MSLVARFGPAMGWRKCWLLDRAALTLPSVVQSSSSYRDDEDWLDVVLLRVGKAPSELDSLTGPAYLDSLLAGDIFLVLIGLVVKEVFGCRTL